MRISQLIRVLSLSLLMALTTAHIWQQLTKFFSGVTTDASYEREQTSLAWPAIVLCPRMPFNATRMQSFGIPLSLWEYYASDCLPTDLGGQCAAIATGDITAELNWDKEQWSKAWNESVVDLSNMISRLRLDRGNHTFTDNITRTILESPNRGRCLMLTMPELLYSYMSYVELIVTDLDVINGLDIIIFEPGLEKAGFSFDFWANRPDISLAVPGTVTEVSLYREEHSSLLGSDCVQTDQQVYSACVMEEAARYFLQLESACFVPAYSLYSRHLNACKTAQQMHKTVLNVSYEFPYVLDGSKCKYPCTEPAFNQMTRQVAHRTANASTIVWISFDTLSVRVVTAYDLFDSVEILSAIGGSLGLFLGYSFKTITDFIVEKLQRKEIAREIGKEPTSNPTLN